MLGLILDQLKLVIDYTGVLIFTFERNALVFLDHQGPIPQEQLARLRFPCTELGLIWQTLASGSSILLDDVYEETRLAQALHASTSNLLATIFQYVHAWMAVPLMLKDQHIGVLVLSSSQKQVLRDPRTRTTCADA